MRAGDALADPLGVMLEIVGVRIDAAAGDQPEFVDAAPEQIAVVRHDDHRAFVFLQAPPSTRDAFRYRDGWWVRRAASNAGCCHAISARTSRAFSPPDSEAVGRMRHVAGKSPTSQVGSTTLIGGVGLAQSQVRNRAEFALQQFELVLREIPNAAVLPAKQIPDRVTQDRPQGFASMSFCRRR